ncbi:hypothetical protein [Flavobacterium sp.]|uniref:hypothetical protein n=1 Tax=Flavobacterium sp. TaxID=239 RepID=UPI0040331EF3
MTLFVDNIESNNLGGLTKDVRKISYNLAKYKLSIEEIIKRSSPNTNFPVVVFRANQYVAIFNCSKDLSQVQLAFINHTVDIQENFNAFADSLTPKTIPAFYDMQEKIKRASAELKLQKVALSDSELIFNDVFEN